MANQDESSGIMQFIGSQIRPLLGTWSPHSNAPIGRGMSSKEVTSNNEPGMVMYRGRRLKDMPVSQLRRILIQDFDERVSSAALRGELIMMLSKAVALSKHDISGTTSPKFPANGYSRSSLAPSVPVSLKRIREINQDSSPDHNSTKKVMHEVNSNLLNGCPESESKVIPEETAHPSPTHPHVAGDNKLAIRDQDVPRKNKRSPYAYARPTQSSVFTRSKTEHPARTAIAQRILETLGEISTPLNDSRQQAVPILREEATPQHRNKPQVTRTPISPVYDAQSSTWPKTEIVSLPWDHHRASPQSEFQFSAPKVLDSRSKTVPASQAKYVFSPPPKATPETTFGYLTTPVVEGWGNKFQDLETNKWKCSSCYSRNDDSIKKCAACETPRSNEKAIDSPGQEVKAKSLNVDNIAPNKEEGSNVPPSAGFGFRSTPGSDKEKVPASGKEKAPGAPSSTAFAFGSTPASDKEKVPSASSSTAFSFGSAPSSDKEKAPSAPSSTAFSFGSTPSSDKEKAPSAPSSTGFSFESTPASDKEKAPSAPSSTGFGFGSTPASDKEKVPSAPSSTAFSFGSTPSSDKEKAPSAPSSTGFSFGSPSVSDKEKAPSAPSSTGFSFGSTSVSDEEKAPSAQSSTGFGSTPASDKEKVPSAPSSTGYSFGSTPASDKEKAPSAPSSTGFGFGSTPASDKEKVPSAPSTGFSFGNTPSSDKERPSAPSSTGFSFGSTSVSDKEKVPSAPSSTGFSFGSTPALDKEKAPSARSSTGFSFGSTPTSDKEKAPSAPSSTGFSFGSTPALDNEKVPSAPSSTGFIFGSTPADKKKAPSAPSSTGFSFGSAPASDKEKAPSAPSSTAFSFGSTPALDNEKVPSAPSSTAFSFGSTPSDKENAPSAPSSTGFSFGSTPASYKEKAPSAPSSTGFSFGSTAAHQEKVPSSAAFMFGSVVPENANNSHGASSFSFGSTPNLAPNSLSATTPKPSQPPTPSRKDSPMMMSSPSDSVPDASTNSSIPSKSAFSFGNPPLSTSASFSFATQPPTNPTANLQPFQFGSPPPQPSINPESFTSTTTGFVFGSACQPNNPLPIAPTLNRTTSSGDAGGFSIGASKSTGKRKIVKPKRPLKK